MKMNESIWSMESKISAFPQLDHDIQTNVLIIGGGLAGVLCALKLHQLGIDYMLIESDRIGRGVTCGTTAKITSQHGLIYQRLIRMFGIPFAKKYWEANEWAIDQFRFLAHSVDCEFIEKDSILYSVAGGNKIKDEMVALNQAQIPAEHTNDLELPFPADGIRFRNQAQFHPLKFLSTIVKGLNLYEYTAARWVDGNTVQTNHGKISANKIIFATHFPILNKHGGYFLKMYQDRSYVMALKDAAIYKGMYVDAEKKGFSFRNYRDLLIIGSGSHRTGKKSTGWQELELLRQKYYPNAHVVSRWATQDCITLDGVPYIGNYSGNTPNLYVASGFNKWGMTSSMLAAGILSDLIQGKQNEFASVFTPSRSSLRPQLLCNAFESAINFFTPTAPRCPHMGCALKWNGQERTWDCPCHGSRFTEDGKLLENPSIKRMKDNQPF